jgi:LmbE family N-acetylglucosaminyl deacetylase
MRTLKLMAVLAHPDDESLGFGGTLAKYAAEGVDVSVLTATRGGGGRYRGYPAGDAHHPGSFALGNIREAELQAAATTLGIRDLTVLNYEDGGLERADTQLVIADISLHLRRLQPDVVLTFGPEGGYGHPDHIAISQFTTAAVMCTAGPAYRVSKLYYLAWPASTWAAYGAAVGRLVSMTDGVERQATPWPEWAITTVIDTRHVWPTVWRAVSCHQSQVAAYQALRDLSPDHHAALWGAQSFYRVFSIVNGGRAREADLFEGMSR